MPRRRRAFLPLLLLLIALVIAVLLLLVLRSETSAPSGDRVGDEPDARVAAIERGGGSRAPEVEPGPAREPGEIRGRVRRRNDGAPAAGVAVRLLGRDGERTATTDGEGRFELADVPRSGRFDLSVNARGFGPLVRRGVRLGRYRRLDLGTLWLSAGAAAEIVVRDVSGDGVAAAIVEAFLAGDGATPFEAGAVPMPVATARTDDTGAARFPSLAADTWAFVARAPGRERRSTGAVALHGGEGVQRFLVTLGAGADLTGIVRERGGDALAGVEIVALRRTIMADESTAPLAVRAVSGRDGAYRLRGLPVGDVVIWCAREGEPLSAVAAVSVPDVGSLDLLLPRPSRLLGRLVQAVSGAPLTDAVVRARFELPLGIPTTVATEPDAHGAFELRFPGRGTIGWLEVEAPGMFATHDGGPPLLDVAVQEGQTVEVTLTMAAGVRVFGVVTSDDGPVSGATVTAAHAHETREATTDYDGHYSFEALRPGAVSFSAARWGHATAQAAVEVPAERLGGGIRQDFDLERGGDATGVVTGAGGVPLAGAAVHVFDEPRALAAETGPDGRFTIGPLSPGSQGLEVVHLEHSPGYTRVAPGEQVQVELVPLLRVHGRVTDAAGRPVPGAVVRAAGSDGGDLDPVAEDWGWLTMDRFAVDADGAFDHRVAIVESRFRVRAEAPGYAPTVIDGSDGPSRIVLRRGVALSGVVQDADGRPVGGAWIGLTRVADGVEPGSVSYPGAWGPPVRAVADARGRFEVTGLEAHRYLVLARVDGLWAARAAVAAPDRSVRIRVPRSSAD